MGDRCNVLITCRKQDTEAICRALMGDESCSMEYEVCPGIVQLEFEEMNYGAQDELVTASESGLIFYGSHCAGANYPAAVFVSNGKCYMACDSIERHYEPVAVISCNGKPHRPHVRDAKTYWRLRKRVEVLIGEMPKRKAG